MNELLRSNVKSHARRYTATGLAVAISMAFVVIALAFSAGMNASLTKSVRESYAGVAAVVVTGLEERTKRLVRAARTMQAAATQNAVVYPCIVASGDAGSPAVTLAATLASSAVPMAPPICWEVFTIAEAIPASPGVTPEVPTVVAATPAVPVPNPSRRVPGSTCR